MAKEIINKETVEHVAKIARLNLTDAEIKKFQKDLNDILSAFKELDKAGEAEPSFQPIPLKDVFRDDEIEQSLTRDEALANTKNKEKGSFKGPRAV